MPPPPTQNSEGRKFKMPLPTPISKAKKRNVWVPSDSEIEKLIQQAEDELNDETQKASKTAHHKILKKKTDPFLGMDEADIDDCTEELYWLITESPEIFDDELDAGYCCTRDQLVYWLEKKYLDTTSYGEDLYYILVFEEATTVDAETDSE